MHDALFAASVRPQTPEILGLRMLPYTIGHDILLHTEVRTLMTLPPAEFAELPLNQRIAALYRSVLICSTTWNGYTKAEPRIVQRSFLGIKRNWRVKMHHWVNVWTREMAKSDWNQVENDLRQHILAGRTTVPVLSSGIPEDKEAYEIANKGEILGGEGRSLGGPLLASVLLFIEKHRAMFGLISDLRPPTSAFDVPYAFALNLFFSELESTGALPIENAAEAQARAEMQQHRVELRAEKARKAAEEQKGQPTP